MIGIIDCNNFYVSCERVFNPKLNNKPVVVLSNNDGCVISRSQEAKNLGIKMGEPAFVKKNFFEANNVNVLSANFELYADMSARVMNIIADSVPDMEIYSVDEAFVDVSGIKNLKNFAFNLKNKIFKWTGIPVSIGIAQTKTLAKAAIIFAKKNKKGVYIINNNVNEVLKNIPINEIWGIGRKYVKKLNDYFVYSAFDFIELPDYIIKKIMKVNGLKTKAELKGINTIDLAHNDTKKSFRTSRTFGKPVERFEVLQEAIAYFADNVATKLRKHKLNTSFLTVYIRTNYNDLNTRQYAQSVTIPVDPPTNSSIVLIKTALTGLKKIFKKGYKYKKGAITVSGLSQDKILQTNLFDPYPAKHKNLMKTIDNIRKQFGKNSLFFGIENNLNDWKSIQMYLSKPYTTDWNNLLTVK